MRHHVRTRRSGVLGGAALLVAAALSVPQQAVQAADEPSLQPYYYQSLDGAITTSGPYLSTTSVRAADLPVTLTMGVRDVPEGLPRLDGASLYAFVVALPEPLRGADRAVQYDKPCAPRVSIRVCNPRVAHPVYSAEISVTIPRGVPCGSYATRGSTVAPRSKDLLYADGRIDVVCPRVLVARPPITVRPAPGPLPFVFSGRYFPSGASPRFVAPLIELHLDGNETPLATVPQTQAPTPSTSFDVGRDLDLACGGHTITATLSGKELARDDFEVRCPALVVVPPALDQRLLPRLARATGTGFGRTLPVDVLLDGVDVGDATTDTGGTAVFQVPVPKGAACGGHQVVMRQRTPATRPSAKAVLLITCPPPGTVTPTAVLDVSPEVVPTGFTARVTGTGLPPGPVLLVWDLGDGVRRPAMGNRVATVAPDGSLSLSLLILRNEPVGPRTLLALDSDGPDIGALRASDTEPTLVVLNSFQPSRPSSTSRVGVLGRR